MRVGDVSVGDQLQCCVARWTWGSGVRKAVIDYMCQVDLGKWCEEGCNRLHVV